GIDVSSPSAPLPRGGLGYIPDDGSITYRLRIYLKPGTDVPDDIDNKDFVFEITSANITTGASPTSSTLQSSSTDSGDGLNQVDVIATQLDFVIQPATSQAYDAPITPSMQVKARDQYGNLDQDYNATPSVTSLDPGVYVLANTTLTTSNGVIT